jgi:hypothetical protein
LVDWGPGQGNIPGKENCWNVAIWFDIGSVVFDGRGDNLGIFIVGPSGRKANREAFGGAFIEFLQANNVQLTLPPRELLGQTAEALESFPPRGKMKIGYSPFVKIKIGQNQYLACPLSQKTIEKDSQVTIEEIKGTMVYIRRKPNDWIEQAKEMTL